MAKRIAAKPFNYENKPQRTPAIEVNNGQDLKIEDIWLQTPSQQLQSTPLSISAIEAELESLMNASASDSEVNPRKRSSNSPEPKYESIPGSTSTGISARSRQKMRKFEVDGDWDLDLYNHGWNSSPEDSGFSSGMDVPITRIIDKADDPQVWFATDTYKLPKLVDLYTEDDSWSGIPEDVLDQPSLPCVSGQLRSEPGNSGSMRTGEEDLDYMIPIEGILGSNKKPHTKRSKVAKGPSIKSGRWTAAEDRALIQGVTDYLGSRGLEPQPPPHFPAEQELKQNEQAVEDACAVMAIVDDTSPMLKLPSEKQQHQSFGWGGFRDEYVSLEDTSSDIKLFDSIFDILYVTSDEDISGKATSTTLSDPLYQRQEYQLINDGHHFTTLPPSNNGNAVSSGPFSPLILPQPMDLSFLSHFTGDSRRPPLPCPHTESVAIPCADRQIYVLKQPHVQSHNELYHLNPLSRFSGGSCELLNLDVQHQLPARQQSSSTSSLSLCPELKIVGLAEQKGESSLIKNRLEYQQHRQQCQSSHYNRYERLHENGNRIETTFQSTTPNQQQQHQYHQPHQRCHQFLEHSYYHSSTDLSSASTTPPFLVSPSTSPQTFSPTSNPYTQRPSPQFPFTRESYNGNSDDDPVKENMGSKVSGQQTAKSRSIGNFSDNCSNLLTESDMSLSLRHSPPSLTSSLFPPLPASQRKTPKTRDGYIIAVSLAMSLCPWSVITSYAIPGRTGVQAQARWSEALDPQVKKGSWTEEEDALLLKGMESLVERNGSAERDGSRSRQEKSAM
ncbi:hypothetical protein BGX27_004754 [Mortierella sp. AM989]|nr:hypothetical protein BGX27_004754 [Mortierella sp. AM989]